MASSQELLEKSEWSVFDKTSKFNHNFLLNIVTKKQSRVIGRQQNNQTHIIPFQTQFGVSDFLKQILKLFFAHSNFLYNFYEQTKSLGDSVFAHLWSFGGTVATSLVALRWLCDSPRARCAWRTKIYMRGASKQ